MVLDVGRGADAWLAVGQVLGCWLVMAGSWEGAGSWERRVWGGGVSVLVALSQSLDTCCYMEIRYSYKVPDVLESSFTTTTTTIIGVTESNRRCGTEWRDYPSADSF